MRNPRTLLVLLALLMHAATAVAQTDTTSEFGRASGGAIALITKSPRQFSGSFSLSNSSGAYRGRRYDASAGGVLLNDRVWFFAAGSVMPEVRFAAGETKGLDARATAQPIDSTTLTAAFRSFDQPALATGAPNYGSLPSSFLSLRSTTMLSDHATFDISVSRRSSKPMP
jgi:hypothetical protein